MVQRSHICYERLASITEMMNNIRWSTMKQRRDDLHLILKIVNDLVDVTTDGILQQTNNLSGGHTRNFRQLSTTVDSYMYSFFPKRAIS